MDPTDKTIYHEAPAHLPRVPGSERAFLQTREKRIRLEARLGQKNVSAAIAACAVRLAPCVHVHVVCRRCVCVATPRPARPLGQSYECVRACQLALRALWLYTRHRVRTLSITAPSSR